MQTYKNNLKEHFLIHLHELLVPLLDISRLLAGIRLVVGSRDGVVTVVLAPLDDLSQDRLIHLPSPLLAVFQKEHRTTEGMQLTLGMGMGVSWVISVWFKSSIIFFKSIERSTTTRSWVDCQFQAIDREESDGLARVSLPTSMVALSLEMSQIFWDAGLASAIVIIGCFEKRLWI